MQRWRDRHSYPKWYKPDNARPLLNENLKQMMGADS